MNSNVLVIHLMSSFHAHGNSVMCFTWLRELQQQPSEQVTLLWWKGERVWFSVTLCWTNTAVAESTLPGNLQCCVCVYVFVCVVVGGEDGFIPFSEVVQSFISNRDSLAILSFRHWRSLKCHWMPVSRRQTLQTASFLTLHCTRTLRSWHVESWPKKCAWQFESQTDARVCTRTHARTDHEELLHSFLNWCAILNIKQNSTLRCEWETFSRKHKSPVLDSGWLPV